MSTDAQACTYAAMILHDSGLPMTGASLAAITKAAGFELRATVPILFANYLSKNSVSSIIEKAASSATPAAGGAAAAAAPAAAAAGKKEEPKKAEKKKEPEPEEDDDMFGGGLF